MDSRTLNPGFDSNLGPHQFVLDGAPLKPEEPPTKGLMSMCESYYIYIL
jgi:hypothetical protein